MQLLLGTTPVAVASNGRAKLVLQNLGPGNVYFDTEGSVTTTSGMKLGVGYVYEFPTLSGDDDLYVVADQAATDLRIVEVG